MKKKQVLILISAILLIAAICAIILYLPRGKSAALYGRILSVEQDGKTYFGTPSGVAEGPDGAFYVTDSALHVLWKVTENDAEIVAGTLSDPQSAATFDGGYADGDAMSAAFDTPTAIIRYGDVLVIADTGNHVLRLYDPETGTVATFAGNGSMGAFDGELDQASFISPVGLCLDDAENLYVADIGAKNVRMIDTYGYVSTFLGENQGFLDGGFEVASIAGVTDLDYENGVLYLIDAENFALRKVESGSLITLAGTGRSGFADGDAMSAGFVNPTALCVRNGVVYVADTGSGSIRRLQSGALTTQLAAKQASDLPQNPRALICASDGRFYCADASAHCLFCFEK